MNIIKESIKSVKEDYEPMRSVVKTDWYSWNLGSGEIEVVRNEVFPAKIGEADTDDGKTLVVVLLVANSNEDVNKALIIVNMYEEETDKLSELSSSVSILGSNDYDEAVDTCSSILQYAHDFEGNFEELVSGIKSTYASLDFDVIL